MIRIINSIPTIQGEPEPTQEGVLAKVLGDVAIKLEERLSAIDSSGDAIVELFEDNGSVGVKVDSQDDEICQRIQEVLNIG